MAKRIIENTHTYFDKDTGEQVSETKTVHVRTKTDVEFYMTFLEAISFVTKIKNGTVMWILAKLCLHAEYNTGICYLAPELRKEIADDLNIKVQYFNQCLMALRKSGIIKDNNGKVFINPVCFWKGELKEREKLMKDKERHLHIIFNPQPKDSIEKKDGTTENI